MKAAEYIKHSQNFARLLGDLKQYRELTGLKLIDTTEAFPKVIEPEYMTKSLPSTQKYKQKTKVDTTMLAHVDLEENEEDGEMKVIVKMEYQRAVEQKKKEDRILQEKKSLAASSEKRGGEEESIDISELESDIDEDGLTKKQRILDKKMRNLRSQSSREATLENLMERDPDAGSNINNYKFFTTMLEYEKPGLSYLEKTERIKEMPNKQVLLEQTLEFDFKVESKIIRRKQFLERIYGRYHEEKVVNELKDVYMLPAIANIKNNHSLKEAVLSALKTELENQRIKQMMKAYSNKECLGYFLKIKIENIRSANYRQFELKKRAQQLWSLARSKFKTLLAIKTCNPVSQLKYPQMKNIKTIRFLQTFDQVIQSSLSNFSYMNSRNRIMDCVGPSKRTREVKLYSTKNKLVIDKTMVTILQ